MKQKNGSCLQIVVVVILMGVCLGALALTAAVVWLPGAAEDAFGKAGDRVEPFTRITSAVQLLMKKDVLLSPANSSGKPVDFVVKDGESVNLIALHLENGGFIKDATSFRQYLIYSGGDTALQSGTFTLSPAMTPIQIARTLQDPNAKMIQVRVLAGWRVEEIAANLVASGLNFKADEFILVATHPEKDMIPETLAQVKTLEGYLYPDAYEFKRNATIRDVIGAMTNRFVSQVNAEMQVAFQKQGLNLGQAVTLASLVQREAMVAEEYPIIASVFLNRFKKGMKFESDPTVQYALGYNASQKTWWTNPLSAKDLKIDSPYNTYVRTGFPPGAIANPSLGALRAVAYPASTPYYYFRARCDGSGTHSFAATYEEHLKNACP